MINARELRIGNLVYSKTSIGYDPAGVIKVRQIKEDGINPWQDMGASGIGKCEDIEPISLTPDWLERFGFKEESTYFERQESPAFVFIKDRDGLPYIGIVVRTYAKYVHQLQNIVFVLTGEELTIKEKV